MMMMLGEVVTIIVEEKDIPYNERKCAGQKVR
jgi:hypothetical protein